LLENNREVKQKTHLNRLNESTFGYFSENLMLFRIVSVCYETDLFVSVVSIKVRNTETNRNILFLVSRNKPKQTRNRSCFGLFRFEPKYFFFHFEDTLPASQSLVNCRRNISDHRRRRKLRFFLFRRSWTGEWFKILTQVNT